MHRLRVGVGNGHADRSQLVRWIGRTPTATPATPDVAISPTIYERLASNHTEVTLENLKRAIHRVWKNFLIAKLQRPFSLPSWPT